MKLSRLKRPRLKLSRLRKAAKANVSQNDVAPTPVSAPVPPPTQQAISHDDVTTQPTQNTNVILNVPGLPADEVNPWHTLDDCDKCIRECACECSDKGGNNIFRFLAGPHVVIELSNLIIAANISEREKENGTDIT